MLQPSPAITKTSLVHFRLNIIPIFSPEMPPFKRADQPIDVSGMTDATDAVPLGSLPGYRSGSLTEKAHIRNFLQEEFYCRDLERMAPHLWIMSTFSSANINSLHRQRVKDREIVITEDPRLHLVWMHNRVFIKPLPRYLCSHDFWVAFLDTVPDPDKGDLADVRRAATGFLRTYRYLIRYESDFRIAKEKGLIPEEANWNQFCLFTSALQSIEDDEVSQRYHYGELRLTRLNLYAPLLIRKFHYEQINGQYADFFGRMFGPILFIFAMISILLNSMQVELAAEQLMDSGMQWTGFWELCRWFSIVSLAGSGILTVSLAALWFWMVADEWIYALRRRAEKKRITRNGSVPAC
jgi:hypothetical protein